MEIQLYNLFYDALLFIAFDSGFLFLCPNKGGGGGGGGGRCFVVVVLGCGCVCVCCLFVCFCCCFLNDNENEKCSRQLTSVAHKPFSICSCPHTEVSVGYLMSRPAAL